MGRIKIVLACWWPSGRPWTCLAPRPGRGSVTWRRPPSQKCPGKPLNIKQVMDCLSRGLVKSYQGNDTHKRQAHSNLWLRENIIFSSVFYSRNIFFTRLNSDLCLTPNFSATKMCAIITMVVGTEEAIPRRERKLFCSLFEWIGVKYLIIKIIMSNRSTLTKQLSLCLFPHRRPTWSANSCPRSSECPREAWCSRLYSTQKII